VGTGSREENASKKARHDHKRQRRGGKNPSRPLCCLAGPGLEAPFVAEPKVKSSAGDPSEVTALGERHWITSFQLLMEIKV